MSGKIRLGVVGCGSFVQNFIPLYKTHPYVEWVAVTDLIRERSEETAKKHGLTRIYDSYEDMLADWNLNAVAIFTQRQLHGPLVIAALKAGKHVYSAVPMATSVEDIAEIIDLVKTTGLTYSMGETGCYRPCSIFCRQLLKSGMMGQFVYGEAQYNHDMRHFYKPYMYSGGPDWKKVAGFPPMFYPTHSTSMILSSTGAYVKKVSGFGFEDHHEDGVFGNGKNHWNNPFSNTSYLGYLSNGGTARISENRRIAHSQQCSYIPLFCGTEASYEFSASHHALMKWKGDDIVFEDLNERLNPEELESHRGEEGFYTGVLNGKWTNSEAIIQKQTQKYTKFPEEWQEIKSGHSGTHMFMADDFCRAAYTGKLSPTNAWIAARYNIPGMIAHESALKGGELLSVPDFGDPPAGWDVLGFDD